MNTTTELKMITVKIFEWDGLQFIVHIEGSLARVPACTILNWKTNSKFDLVYPLYISSSFVKEVEEILSQEESLLNSMENEV